MLDGKVNCLKNCIYEILLSLSSAYITDAKL